MGNCYDQLQCILAPQSTEQRSGAQSFRQGSGFGSDVVPWFVQHIADHGGHKRGTVKGVLSDMCECLVEMLLEGKKVQLDELGDFWLSLTSTGAENCQKFTAANIKGVNILFTPGADFENLIDRAEFNPVASRVAQVLR